MVNEVLLYRGHMEPSGLLILKEGDQLTVNCTVDFSEDPSPKKNISDISFRTNIPDTISRTITEHGGKTKRFYIKNLPPMSDTYVRCVVNGLIVEHLTVIVGEFERYKNVV